MSSYRDGKLTVEPAAPPCPFCSAPAHWKELIYQGSFGTGMEAPELTIGCVPCGIWFPQKRTEDWSRKKGHFSIEKKARAELLALWSNRSHIKDGEKP